MCGRGCYCAAGQLQVREAREAMCFKLKTMCLPLLQLEAAIMVTLMIVTMLLLLLILMIIKVMIKVESMLR